MHQKSANEFSILNSLQAFLSTLFIVFFKNSFSVITEKLLPDYCTELHIGILLHLPVDIFELTCSKIELIPP